MNRCRIINGCLKRRFINAPAINSTRPTSDRIKQAIFNVLFHRFYINFNETFAIDLFAGSGALGIEAISCGSPQALFIDSNSQVLKCLENNLKNLKIENLAKTLCRKAESVSDNLFLEFSKNFNNILVFMDPPYIDKRLLLNQLSRFRNLFQNQNLTIVVESDEEIIDENFQNFHTLNHGNTFVNVFSN